MWLIRDVILISALVSSFCIYAHKDDSEKPPIFTWVNCNATGSKCLEIDFQDGFPNDLAGNMDCRVSKGRIQNYMDILLKRRLLFVNTLTTIVPSCQKVSK